MGGEGGRAAGEAEEGITKFPDLLKLLRAAWLIWPRNVQNKCSYREPSPLSKKKKGKTKQKKALPPQPPSLYIKSVFIPYCALFFPTSSLNTSPFQDPLQQ